MKTLRNIYRVLLMAIILTSCGEPTDSPTPQSTETPSTRSTEPPFPPDGILELKPVSEERLVETEVEFLIDNSNSIKNECNPTGVRRYDFVNFILKFFHTIPEPLSQKLSVGVGSFGNNPNTNYVSLVPPRSFDHTFPTVSDPDSDGNYQNFVDGIKRAKDEMDTFPAIEKILIIITDGELFGLESFASIQTELQAKSSSGNLSIIVALICDKVDSTQWYAFADENISVVTLEDLARPLFKTHLQEFLPGIIVVSLGNYESPLPIAGYYTSATFAYWNPDFQNPSLLITDNTTGNVWDAGANLSSYPIPYGDGCPQHNLTIPHPGTHGLLVIRPRGFQDLTLSARISGGGAVEVINNNPIILEFEVGDTQSDDNLSNWRDCFSVTLSDTNGNPLIDLITGIPLATEGLLADNDLEILRGKIKWIPLQFQGPQDFTIKVQLSAVINNNYVPLWESKPRNIPIMFKASYIYDPPQPTYTPLTPVRDDTREISLMFQFRDVASEPRIFLVTALNQDELRLEKDEEKWGDFPRFGIQINDQEAFEIHQLSECQLSQSVPGEIFACVKPSANPNSLYREYILRTYDYFISGYKYNQLFFIWLDDKGTKASVWRCDLGQSITCTDDLPQIKIAE